MRRSAVPPVAEPTPWRLYLLMFVTWVLVALLGGPDAVAGTGNGPLPGEPLAAVHEAAARTLRSTYWVASRRGTDPTPKVDADVAVDPAADVLLMWDEGTLIAFREGDDVYAGSEAPDKPWLHYDWPRDAGPDNHFQEATNQAFDLETWEAPLWLDGVIEASRTGPRTYSGTLDMRRAGPRHPGPAYDGWAAQFHATINAMAVPFEVAVDSTGRLVRITLHTDALGSEDGQTYYLSRHGERVRPPKLRDGDVEELFV